MQQKPKLWKDIDLDKSIAIIKSNHWEFENHYIKKALKDLDIEILTIDRYFKGGEYSDEFPFEIISLLKYIHQERGSLVDFIFLGIGNYNWRILYDGVIEKKLVKFGIMGDYGYGTGESSLCCRLQSIPGAIKGGEIHSHQEAVKSGKIYTFEEAMKNKGDASIKLLNKKSNGHYFDLTAEDPLSDEVKTEIKSLLESEKKPEHNHCYVLCGPSGSGKTTLINHLLNYMKYMDRISKVTTRPPRKSGINEGTIHTSHNFFRKLAIEGRLVGIRKYSGNLYAYPRKQIMEAKQEGLDIFIDSTDINSTLQLKNEYPDYVKIIALESDPEDVIGNLVKRLSGFKHKDEVKREYFKKDNKRRIIGLCKRFNNYEKLIYNADFILKEEPFMFKQRTLRRYINECRRSKLVMPRGQVQLYHNNRMEK